MVFDRNSQFGEDQHFSEGALRVAQFLWENAGKDPSTYPRSYLENLRHEYSDGKVSMLDLIDRVDLGPEATYEEYCEVVDMLLYADPARFPNIPGIVEIQPSQLDFELDDPEFDFSEFGFAEEVVEESVPGQAPAQDPMSEKMETFLKKVISSVYIQGITEVTDVQGNPPTAANDYLLSEDGKSFSGIFYDSPPNEQAKQYPFKISDKGNGQWQIQY